MSARQNNANDEPQISKTQTPVGLIRADGVVRPRAFDEPLLVVLAVLDRYWKRLCNRDNFSCVSAISDVLILRDDLGCMGEVGVVGSRCLDSSSVRHEYKVCLGKIARAYLIEYLQQQHPSPDPQQLDSPKHD
jgi:hypothetical protein